MLRPTSKLSAPGGGNFECYFNNHRGNSGRDSLPETAGGWIFPNTIGGALDLDNLADRVIKPVLRGNGLQWKGWQAYRRGLATNLKRLGVPDTVIRAILRHTDVGTRQRFYIKTVRDDVRDTMKQIERKIHRAAVVQQPEPTGLVN